MIFPPCDAGHLGPHIPPLESNVSGYPQRNVFVLNKKTFDDIQ